jgi:dTDP-glucose 4,6-dehydratase
VAGGAGFLGSHLCDRLLDAGDTVVCVDDLTTGQLENIAHHDGNTRFTFVHEDVADTHFLDLVPGGAYDAVMHLASPASPPAYLARPIATLDAGSAGTRNLLDIAVASSARFFLASTSEVYGDPLEHPQRESYWGNVNPIGERSVYDEAKRFAEALTMAYHRVRELDVGIARIFNTYGPRMRADDGRVVTNFIFQALTGQPITVYGDGTQTRSFCFVDDEVAGLLAVLDSGRTGPFNVGNPTEFTMLELADLVREITGSTVPVEHRPLPSDDPRVRKPDITLVQTELGWTPRVELREGLERTIAWFRSEVAA